MFGEGERPAQRQADAFSFVDIERNVAVFGNPQQCIEKIRTLPQEVGMGQLICCFTSGSLLPHQQVLTFMERLPLMSVATCVSTC